MKGPSSSTGRRSLAIQASFLSDPYVKALQYICRFPHLGRFQQNTFSWQCDKNTATHVFVECIVFSAMAVRSISLRFSSETEESLRSAEPFAAMLLPMRSRAVQITFFLFFVRFIVFHVLHLIFLLNRSCLVFFEN